MKKFFYLLLFALLILLVKNCATPMGPTGGERDTEGPTVVSTEPENGTTNFEGDEVSFSFDQFIDRNSFRQHVSIEPDLGIQYEVDFRRKTATVEFQSPLPDNTTIIVKLGTDVSDTDRNEMDSPFDLALSTGDVLDNATITGRLLNANTGKGDTGDRVFLYAEPFDFTERARYVAETDTAGRIRFGYLSDGSYKAFYVNDINQNRIWDQERESAQPFQLETYQLAQDDSLDLGTIYISSPDTVSPKVDGVGLLSEIRLRLRLSEEVIINDESEFVLTDTLGNNYTRAIPLYTSEQDPTVLFAQSFQALPDTMEFLIRANNISDAAENPLQADLSAFIGSAQEDTTALQTISHNAGSGLFPDEALEITYSRFINDQSVVDSLIVLEGDTTISDWQPLEVDNHILRIQPEEIWQPGIRYQFRVWNPWTEEREQVEPEIWQRNQLGGIELSVDNYDSTRTSYLTLTDQANSILVDTTFTGSVIVDNLPPLEYQAVIFEDRNENGKWDSGTLLPFSPPEKYAVRNEIPVREGFTSEVSVPYQTQYDTTGVNETPAPGELNNNSNR